MTESHHQLGFFGVAFSIVLCRFGRFGDDAGAAVWDELAVGGDVADDGVDRFGWVGEGAGGPESLGV